MNARHVALLAGLAALALVLAFALGRSGTVVGGGDALLPGLQGRVNDVTGIGIQPGGAAAFRIERGETGWTVPSLHGYPADPGKVRRLVLALSDARVLEAKTANPALYERLGVEDVGDAAGSGAAVTLEGVENAGPVIVGDRELPGGRGTYVRLSGEPSARLVDQVITVDAGPIDWLDREIMDVAAERVSRIGIRHPDGDEVEVVRGEDGRLVLANVPEGREVSGPTAPDALARALAALRLEDVRPAAGLEDAGEPVVALFTLDDGTRIRATTRTLGDERWTGFEVTPPEDPESPAAALARRVDGWAYRLPAWKAEQFVRRLDELLRPLPAGD